MRALFLLKDARNLPARDYIATRDPLVHISVLKDRRSLRKRSKQVLAEFNTRTVRHQLNPIFEETFTAQLPTSDVKVHFGPFWGRFLSHLGHF